MVRYSQNLTVASSIEATPIFRWRVYDDST